MENEGTIDKRVGDFSKTTDIVQTIIIFLIALLVPTFLGEILSLMFGAESVIATKSQLIIGSIVNTALVMSALNLKGKAKIAGVVTMPSIATIFGGYVFGTAATVYMVCMMPAIWLGNFALVYSYKYIFLKKEKNFFLAGVVGIIVKVAIIFGYFLLLKFFGLFPETLVSTLQTNMSLIQAVTATIGVILAFCIYKIEMKSMNKKDK